MPADPNPSSKPEAPTICDSYNSDDADVELISSDNVSFKVHSYRLQFASPVFRSMVALAKSSSQRDPIHLTDTTFEREEIIERALDMIYTLDFDYDSDDHDLELVLCVIEFAKKWEISLITDIIRKDLERVINSKDGPIYHFDSFLIALKLDNHKLAASYVKMAGKDGWFDAKTDDGNDLEDWGPFNFTTEHFLSDTPKAALSQNHPLLDIAIDKKSILGQIPHDHFLCIPPTVVWVILRAQGLEGKTKLSYRAIVRRLLDLAYPPPKSEEPSNKRKAED